MGRHGEGESTGPRAATRDGTGGVRTGTGARAWAASRLGCG